MNSGPWDKKEKVGTTPSADRIKGGEVMNQSPSGRSCQREALASGGGKQAGQAGGEPTLTLAGCHPMVRTQ